MEVIRNNLEIHPHGIAVYRSLACRCCLHRSSRRPHRQNPEQGRLQRLVVAARDLSDRQHHLSLGVRFRALAGAGGTAATIERCVRSLRHGRARPGHIFLERDH